MKFCRPILTWLFLALAVHGQTAALPAGGSPFAAAADEHTAWDIVSGVSAAAPGQPFWAAVRVKIEPPWHIYWINYGDAGEATSITWDLPPGWQAGPVQWPTPAQQAAGSLVDYIYEGTPLFLTQITPPADLKTGTTVTLKATVHWMECATVCLLPTTKTLSLDLPVAASAPPAAANQTLLEAARAALPQPATEFDVSAWRAGDKLFLGFAPTAGAGAPGEISAAYFFSADAQTRPAAPQVLHHTAAGWVLEMDRVASAPPDAKSLPGVLTITGSDKATLAFSLNPPLGAGAPAQFAGAIQAAGSTAGPGGLAGILLLAFFGGLLLNIMPCVFPVLAIKVLGLVKQSGAERRRVVMHGLTFALGVLASMWVLTGVLLALRAGGAQLGWGFQLQQPGFVLGLAIFFLLFALSLSGVFEIGGSLIGLGADLTAKAGLSGSFFQGALAVVVATPCTAPLLAPALGAAFALPPLLAFLAFTFVALGLATPYLLLSLFPGLAKWLPRPGAWMETFKQFMAFPLYATTAFLLYTLNGQVSADKFLNILFALVVVALAAWVYGRFATPAASPSRRRFGQIGALALFALAAVLAYWPQQELNWEPWSAARVTALQKEGRPIYVDFTARWCTNCWLNEKAVFSSGAVLQAIADQHVALLRADLTKPDAAITAELARFGQAGVPFNLVYLPGRAAPIALPTALTPGIVLDALAGKSLPPAAQ
ncbi:MAG TPA: protein-disulfide reductase DsbD domain-containing protein [Opitutales bacterium]|nr:protein-disulfide reductase DsbD domain-containing protein [Opitutales bacterium]